MNKTKFKKGDEITLIYSPIKKYIGEKGIIDKVIPVLKENEVDGYIGPFTPYKDNIDTTAYYKINIGKYILPKYASDKDLI